MVRKGSDASFERLLLRYAHERMLSHVTVHRARAVLDLFRREAGARSLRQVTPARLLRWRDQVLARASATTWNTYLRQLRAIGNFGVEVREIKANPFQAVRYVPAPEHRRKTVAHDSLRHAFTLLEARPRLLRPAWFWRTLLKTLAYTGMRRRQLVTLRWHDIDFTADTILLRAEGSKTRREWIIPLHPAIRADLLQLRVESQRAQGGTLDDQTQVFNARLFNPRYAGAELTGEQVTRALRRLSKHFVDGALVTPHRLRHTLATRLARAGDIKTLQSLLGHRDVRTTLSYVETSLDDMRALLAHLPVL